MNCPKQLDLDKLSCYEEDRHHATIEQRKQRFRETVDELIGATNERRSTKNAIAKRDRFLNAIAIKCQRFKNIYSPLDVIADAYEIGQSKISEGKSIPNPEAWMRVATWYLLHQKSREVQKEKKRIKSLKLIGKIAAPVDSINPYRMLEQAEQAVESANRHQRLEQALSGLTPLEHRLLRFRQVDKKSWEEIRQELKFKGTVQALRKQGSRALAKARLNYRSLED